MKVDEITVEVRDINLTRIGALRPEDYRLTCSPLHNATGTWTLNVPADHWLVPTLRQPGSGIVVTTHEDVVISGPVTRPEKNVSLDDLGGTIQFSGESDETYFGDRLCWPQPANSNPRTQNVDYDVRSGAAESVLRAYINANLGPAAPAGRSLYPAIGFNADQGRGGTITKQARFDKLDEFVYSIANTAGLWVRMVQRGSQIFCETSQNVDRSGDIRLDVRNRTMSGYKLAQTPPGMTHVIVGAQDVTYDRLFAEVSTAESQQAATQWNRRREAFVNQAYAGDETAWTQAALEQLSDQGKTVTSVQAIPNDDEDDRRFGRDWNLGDKVTVVADGREYPAFISGMVLKVDQTGVQVGIVLGDITAFNETLGLSQNIARVDSRLAVVEKNLASGVLPVVHVHNGGWGSSGPPNGQSGTPFTCPIAGKLSGIIEMSGFYGGTGSTAFNVYINGYGAGQLYMFHNTANEHRMFNPSVFANIPVVAGTNYIWVTAVYTNSDSNDRFAMSATVVPN